MPKQITALAAALFRPQKMHESSQAQWFRRLHESKKQVAFLNKGQKQNMLAQYIGIVHRLRDFTSSGVSISQRHVSWLGSTFNV